MTLPPVRTIMILEEEPIIAMDIVTMLEAEGFRNIEVLVTCADAVMWIANRTPSVAVVDVQLKDGSSIDVVRMLRDRSVPVIVCSGVRKADVDPVFSSATWLQKPCRPEELTAALYASWDLPQT